IRTLGAVAITAPTDTTMARMATAPLRQRRRAGVEVRPKIEETPIAGSALRPAGSQRTIAPKIVRHGGL
ncbi:hypothetical protein C1884_29880, partial [Pseudomonas sp. GW460-R15]